MGTTIDQTPPDEPEPEGPTVRPFLAFLAEHNEGQTAEECTREFHDLVESVQAHGKKGTFTLQVTLAPATKGDNTVVAVDDVTVKAPKADRASKLYFIDQAGNLTRHNPMDTPLPLTGLDGGKATKTTDHEETGTT